MRDILFSALLLSFGASCACTLFVDRIAGDVFIKIAIDRRDSVKIRDPSGDVELHERSSKKDMVKYYLFQNPAFFVKERSVVHHIIEIYLQKKEEDAKSGRDSIGRGSPFSSIKMGVFLEQKRPAYGADLSTLKSFGGSRAWMDVVYDIKQTLSREHKDWGVILWGRALLESELRFLEDLDAKFVIAVGADPAYTPDSDKVSIIKMHKAPEALKKLLDSFRTGDRVLVSLVKISSRRRAASIVALWLILSFLISILSILYFKFSGRRRANEKVQALSKKALRKLPLSLYHKNITHIDMGACVICLDTFTSSSICRILPCKHIFHPACVDPWLVKKSGRCPYCQVLITV